MSNWKQLRAILLLPGMVTVVVPAIIVYATGMKWPPSWWSIAFGTLLILLGLSLMVLTIRLFVMVGKGTLAPWSPTQKLIVHGIYRYVRNPMITGVFCILLGEAILFGSWWLLGWFGVFVLVNVIYIPLLEEPGLARRFGSDYLLYKRNVPRWIPRLTPWEELPEPANARQEGGHYE